jgi:GDP-6-deoxy-D-talose 4-dehydrogenase
VAPPSDPPRRKRVLITGITGFTGRYVAAELADAGYEIVGLTHSGDEAGAHVHAVDLCDRAAVLSLVSGMQLDAVVHLAAISFVAHGDADAIYRVNVVGTRNLLEALDQAGTTPRVVVLASSANIYGNATVEPIAEDTPPAPANDYAVSKLAMEYMAQLWHDRLPIVITRPFNYTGVGQGRQFLVPKIVDHYARQASEIELGNTDVVRDFLDVRDVARLYRAIVERAPIGETLNLCSGQGHSLREVIDLVDGFAGYHIDVRVNPTFVRANDVKRLVGSPRRIHEVVGRFALRPLEETLAWMLSVTRADLDERAE